MRPAFIPTVAGIASAMITAASKPACLLCGSELVLQSELSLLPYGILPAGFAFLVISHCLSTGIVELRAVQPHVALTMWGQTLILQPFETEDAIRAINGENDGTRYETSTGRLSKT